MKKFLFIAIAALALFSSCTKTPSVSVGASIPESGLSASGGTVQVNVTSDGEWRTSADDEGVVIEPSSGSGSQSVSIKVPGNTSTDEKNMTVTFYSVLGTSTGAVYITQKAPSVSVEPRNTTVSPLGGNVEVTVTSDGGWKISAADGIAVNPSSSSENESVTVITVPANTSDSERDVNVMFCSALNSSVSDTVTIHQNSVKFSVDPHDEDIDAAGGTLDFTVNADGGWKTVAESGVTVDPFEGSGNQSVKVTVKGNTNSTTRDLKVIFYSTEKSLSDTVTIHQKAPGVSVTKQSADTVAVTGGTVTVDVTSDGGFTAPAGDGFKVEPSEWKDSGSKQVKITVDPNATGSKRDVKVEFCSKLNSSVSDTVTIHQKSMDISVTPSGRTVSATGGEVTFSVTADGAWNASADSDGVEITPFEDSKSAKVKVPANTTGKTRTVSVKFWLIQNEKISKTVTISQESIVISLDPSTKDVSASGDTFEVAVTADGKWKTYRVDSGGNKITASDGLTLTPALGTLVDGNKKVTVKVLANATGQERQMYVKFYSEQDSGISRTLTINQKALNISVTQPTDSVSAAGGIFEVPIKSDEAWTAQHLDDSSSGEDDYKNTGVKGETKFKIKIPENTTAKAKDRRIRFYLTNHSTVCDTVTFYQKAPSISVTLDKFDGEPGERDTLYVHGAKDTIEVKVTCDGKWKKYVGEWAYLDNDQFIYPGKITLSPNKDVYTESAPIKIFVPANTDTRKRKTQVRFFSANNPSSNRVFIIVQSELQSSSESK